MPMQLLYYPPSYSKYHPIEQCWGIPKWYWHGTTLVDVDVRLEWAKRA
jgi:Rhodopirellula transposase DDE domain